MAERKIEMKNALQVLKAKGAFLSSLTPRDLLGEELIFDGAEEMSPPEDAEDRGPWFLVSATKVASGEKIMIRCATKRMVGYCKALVGEYPVALTFIKVGERSIDIS